MMNNGRRGARRGTAAVSVLALVLALLNATMAAAAVSTRVELRVLVVDDGSAQIAAITEQLDIEGVPYTPVLLADAARPVITDAYLATGAEGHFQAVVMPNSTGTSRTSAPSLSAAEVAAIAAYRTAFAVREVDVDEWPGVQVGLQAAGAAGTWSGAADGMTGTVTDAATAAGWGYLEGSVTFSAGTWAIVSTPLSATSAPPMPAGAEYTPYLTVEVPGGGVGTVLGSYRAPSGTEQLVVTAGIASYHQHFQLLAHGIVTWLTRGVHFGHQRAYYSQHFDDAFAYDARWDTANNCTPGEDCPPGVTTTTPDIRMTADDVDALVSWQVANGYQPTLAFNGYYALNDAEGEPWTTTDPLTEAFVEHRLDIRWLNHGYEHLYQGCQQDLSVVPWVCTTVDGQPVAPDGSNLAWVSQADIAQEILQNVTLGNTLGLPFDPAEYLSGEHSGVAITPQQPADNPEFAAALATAGITSIATDASRGSAQRVVGSALTVPRHPVALYFNVSTVAEEVDEYNWIYLPAANGGSGYCEAIPVTCLSAPLSLDTGFADHIVPTDVANSMQFVLRNDPRPFYAHVSNLTGPDRLGLQLMSAMLDTYDSWFADSAPVLNLTLTQAATALGNQQSWAATGMAADSPVTGYLQDGVVVVDNPTAVLAPLTVPEGTTISGQPFGESYGGERSGWVGGDLLLVTPAAAAPVFTSAATGTFTVGTAGTFTVSANAVTSFAQSGVLPAGLTFVDNADGTATLAGVPGPGGGGSYPLSLTATNLAGATEQSFVLTVVEAPWFTSASSTTMFTRTAGSFTVTASGSPAPVLTLAGVLPPGVTFSDGGGGTGTISGTPADGSTGTFSVTVTATNSTGQAEQLLTVVVKTPPPTIPGAPAGIEAYVTRVYSDLLGRGPDPVGLAGWTSALESGTPYGEVANGITYSDEYRARLIAASYTTYLGRGPDPSGAADWLAAMRSGATIQQMEAGFVASEEYYAKAGGTDAAWVAQLYQHVLGRAAAATEIQAWVTALAGGASRYQVSMGFLVSYEHLTDVVDAYYWDLLGRGIDPTGNHDWVIAIQRGVRVEAVIAGIIASDEYRAKV
jgi:hypothetical protein